MVYAVKLNKEGLVITVNSFEKAADVPKDLFIYKGDIAPDKLLLKTRQELGI
jgi:hypothetical protein